MWLAFCWADTPHATAGGVGFSGYMVVKQGQKRSEAGHTVKDFVAKCVMVIYYSSAQREAKRLWGFRQRESIMKQLGTMKRSHTKCLWEVQKKPRLGI